MDELVKKSEGKPCPYAESVNNLCDLLAKAIKRGTGFSYVYALRRNIAYSLQYLEFLDRCITDLNTSKVICKLNYKVFIMVGISIIESLIHYLLIKHNYYPETNWELELIAKGNEKRMGNKIIKVDSHIYRKLTSSVLKEISFNKMLDIAEKRKVLGSNHNLYSRLNHLRKLRNKIHLHLIEGTRDTDWNRFKHDAMRAMTEVIHSLFTSAIFRPSNKERAYFEYLKKYFEDFNLEIVQKMWPLVLDELKEKHKPTYALLQIAKPVKVKDNLIEIQFEVEARFQKELVEREDHFKKTRIAYQRY